MALLDRFRTARPAWEDPDPAVRAEGVRGLRGEEGGLLASILKNDPDATVRKAALRKIEEVELLTEAARSDADVSVRDEASAILLRLAIESKDEKRALHAAEAIGDARHLATLARSARSASVRESALARILDEKTLALVAKTAEDSKQRLQALERLSGEEARADVALRSEHKDVALQALEGLADAALLREIAQHARAKAAARRAHALLEGLETQSRPKIAPAAAPPEPDEAPGERARREAREHAIDSRRAVIERVEALAGEDIPARLAEAAAAWERVPPLEDARAAALQKSFEEAVAAVRGRHERAANQEAERVRAAAEVEETQRLAQERAATEQREKQNRSRLLELEKRAHALARAQDAPLKDAERAMREIRAALQDAGPLPTKLDRETLVEKLKQARAALYPRLQELREADEWKRWANTQVQEELVARMEALAQADDLDKAGIELHVLSDRWRQFSQARKQEAEALWLRFKTAREALQARLEEHFKKKAAEEQAHLARKLALCEQAESLAGSSDWIKTADKIKALQAEWKTLGPVPRKEQKRLWERFHAACDRFFSARKQDLLRRKDEWSKNLEKKQALIAQAEALGLSSEWEATAAEIRKLQAEWKAAGPVKKNKSETLWQRFNAACDVFFERYKNKDQIAASENAALREALVAELAALTPTEPGASPSDDLAARIQDVLGRWRQAPALAGPEAATLHQRFSEARDRLIEGWPAAFKGTDLDPEANRAKRAKLVTRMEALLQASAGPAADSFASLADRLKEALATNAMGGRAAIEARWREAANEVEQLQAAWKRSGPVPGEAGRELEERFKKACDAFSAKRPRESQNRVEQVRASRPRRDRR